MTRALSTSQPGTLARSSGRSEPESEHDCFECSAPLVGPFCPECNPAIKKALGYAVEESQPAGEHDLREAVAIVEEWLAMAKETPKPLHSSLNYVPICASEIEAIDAILAALKDRGGR